MVIKQARDIVNNEKLRQWKGILVIGFITRKKADRCRTYL